ncbi:DUF2779 domain-containing protein [Sphingosinicellaceae bacterium]|nr:DUF2779 domain-containing protein [Sphingosinicellaceae bacterium]
MGAGQFPDLEPTLTSLADRLVDLLPVVRRNYYHRDMRGSWSIKAVLPTLAPELGYDNLDVRSGTDAQDGYLKAIDPPATFEQKAAICGALLAYCRRDTEAMNDWTVLLHRYIKRVTLREGGIEIAVMCCGLLDYAGLIANEIIVLQA